MPIKPKMTFLSGKNSRNALKSIPFVLNYITLLIVHRLTGSTAQVSLLKK
eukprot:CCRYP_002054-RC/>CCRYP_002054-RC protein AED:0.45 eAED:0.45 QI:0/-1/0/1/-1/0/1/0/49